MTGDALRTYQRRLRYYPWHGRGLVQITWERNYQKFGIEKAEDALKWDVALRCLFEGCIKGMFTGKKLSDYISEQRQDYVGARRVVNGQDKAELIAKAARSFHAALLKAEAAPVAEKPSPDVPVPVTVTASARPSIWAVIFAALGKLAEQPQPLPPQLPPPAPGATPTPDLLAVANRIEERLIAMLELLKALNDKMVAQDAAIEQVKAHVADLRAQLAASPNTVTPELQAAFDALNALADANMQKLNAAATA